MRTPRAVPAVGLLGCLLCAQYCPATILVIGITPGKVIIAGDSRVAAPWGIEDTECKIAALGPRAVYAASGVTGLASDPQSFFHFLWFARQTAIQEFEKLGAGDLPQLAEVWAVSAEEHFAAMRLMDWSFSMRAVPNHTTITSAHFARASQEGVEFLSVNVECLDYPTCLAVTHTFVRHSEPGIVLDGDHGAIAFISNFLNGRWRTPVAVRPDDPYSLGYLAAAAVASRRFPDIGGAVDVAELSRNQNVRWYRKKHACPALE